MLNPIKRLTEIYSTSKNNTKSPSPLDDILTAFKNKKKSVAPEQSYNANANADIAGMIPKVGNARDIYNANADISGMIPKVGNAVSAAPVKTVGNVISAAPVNTVGGSGAPIAPISILPQGYNGYNGNDANNIVNNDKIRALYDKVMNAPQFTYDPNTDPQLQSVKAMYLQEGDRAARNNLARMMNAWGGGMNTAAASAAATAQNDANNRFMGLVPEMYRNAYSQYQAQRVNDLNNLNTAMGIDTTQYNRARNAIADTNAAEDRKRKLYEESVTGLGKQYDYSQAIKDNREDGDPTNDWQIPILQQQKEAKMAGMVNDFKANVNQYYNDFQDAINKLDPNDPIYEQKKAILLAARAAKLEKMRQDAILQADKEWQRSADNPANAYKEAQNALNQEKLAWQMSPDNPANIYKTAQATNAANKVPAMTTAEKNQYRAEAYQVLKNLDPAEAKNALEFKRQEIESILGYSGYVSLYNDILRSGVESGNINKYDTSPKEPGTVSWMDQYMSDLLNNVQKPSSTK